MATREASQEHAVLLELQQILMAVKAAEYLSNSAQHPFANPLSLGCQLGAREDFVWCQEQLVVVTGHGFSSFTMYNAAARHVERGRRT
jgi:hypothetical protein